MKKALWLRVPQFRAPETLDRLADELTQYRPLRPVARRTPERAEQERRYPTQVKEWLRLPENRWCRVYQLWLGRRAPASQGHHYQGRHGMLLRYKPFWIPVRW